jgi:regulator of ribosome biosynthesis
MVFDETTGEYRPRFGYKRINNGLEELPIVEIKDGQDPNVDPWEDDRKQKKSRVDKNEKNRLKNIGRIEKMKQKGKLIRSYGK